MAQLTPTIADKQVLKVELKPLDDVATVSAATLSASVGDNNTSDVFDTNNWDTVFAVRLTDVNKAIINGMAKNPNDYPSSWSAEIPAGPFTKSKSGSGTFGAWQLTMGGSGTIVRMHIPVLQCSVTSGETSISVTNATAYIEVYLNLLPISPTSKDNLKLVVRTTSSDPDNPVVVVTQVTYEQPTPPVDGLGDALKALLQTWFNQNLSAFLHVFAAVNLNMSAASADFQWLKPTATSYAYFNGHDLDSSLLGVLCMTLEHLTDSTEEALEAGAIPQGARAGFSISQEMFLSEMVFPHLSVEFTKADSSSFALTRGGNWIENTKDVPLHAVKNAGTPYHPVMTKFTFSVEVSQIKIYAYIHIPISPGIDAYAEMTSYYGMELVEKNGNQYITYTRKGDPDTKKWYEVAPWVTGLEITGDVILAIVGAVVGGVTISVERVVIRVIIAIITGGIAAAIAAVLEKIPEWIAGNVPDALPPITDFVTNATASTKWSDSGDFKLTSVSLNGALQLGGDPQFGSQEIHSGGNT